MIVQLKKGMMELLVLFLLKEQDRYGYELVEEISKHIDISEGTIYPLLRRISKEDYVSSYLKESSNGPSRKYYSLSPKGEEAFKEQLAEWNKFKEDIDGLLGRNKCD